MPSVLLFVLLGIGFALLPFAIIDVLRSYLSLRSRRFLSSLQAPTSKQSKPLVCAFFHPFAAAGGGGERVLWTAVNWVQKEASQRSDQVVICVYTGDSDVLGRPEEQARDAALSKVKERFGLSLSATNLRIIPLRRRWLVEESTYPRFTLLGQSLGSALLALEALMSTGAPDLFIDTMGYAFSYPVVYFLCPKTALGSYTHYPAISTTMLARVRRREQGHTNPASVAGSWWKSEVKFWYYLVLAQLYAFSLRLPSVLMVNSSWTQNHIDSLLSPFFLAVLRGQSPPSSSTAPKSKRVFPPCDTRAMAGFPITQGTRSRTILSIAQFRPEKEHAVQLRAFARLLELRPEFASSSSGGVQLVLAGSVRGEEDSDRVASLRQLATSLGIEQQTRFAVNLPYAQLLELLKIASVGLHTMKDEHFGITVVEFQAAGLLVVVHGSAGPGGDIVVPIISATGQEDGELLPTGFQADSVEDFARKLEEALSLKGQEEEEMRERARRNSERFGEEQFEKGWEEGWEVLRKDVERRRREAM